MTEKLPDDAEPNEIFEHCAKQFAQALEATKLVQIVEARSSPSMGIHLQGRVKPDDEGRVIHQVLPALQDAIADKFGAECCFVGKEYLRKRAPTGERRSVYAWVFSLGHSDVRAITELACEKLADAAPPPQRYKVSEVPLLGPPTPQGGGGRRGAATIG